MELEKRNRNAPRPKIVHLTTGHLAFDVRVFQKECRSLSKAGYDVVLVVPHERDEEVGHIRVKALPIRFSRLYRFTIGTWLACRLALGESAILYHFHDPELVPIGVLLRALKKKVIYDVHDDTPATFADKEYILRWLRRPLMKLARVLEDAGARRFSAVISATPAIGQRFGHTNPQTVVVQNFVLPEEMTTNERPWSEREPIVAFIGAMSLERGLCELVEAMSLLPDSVPARLVLAGRFANSAFRDKLTRMPGWARVNEAGVLDRQSVANLLSNVCAGIVTFLPRPNHLWAGPNKMFEYMSAGIPVIASDFPLWREIIQGARCGLLVNPEDSKQIALAIEYLVSHRDEAREMGQRGRSAVERHYSWATEERKLLQLYQTLLGAPLQPREKQPTLAFKTAG